MSQYKRMKEKELDEARKAGTAPAVKDSMGRDINPHIPAYLTQVPWWVDKEHKPTLDHQRSSLPQAKTIGVEHEQAIVQQAKEAALSRNNYSNSSSSNKVVKFRKGACENCGSMEHTTKGCVERPKAKSAKAMNRTLVDDDAEKTTAVGLIRQQLGEAVGNPAEDAKRQMLSLVPIRQSYDMKRDAYQRYDADEHIAVVRRHEMQEEERQKIRAQALDAEHQQAGGKTNNSNNKDDKDKEEGNAKPTSFTLAADKHTKTVTRDLRIREDRAKYLYNLDVDSAYYDPKSRSMRANPNVNKPDEVFQGDNALRQQGGIDEFFQLNLFAWEQDDGGGGGGGERAANIVADPSAVEMKYREFLRRREENKKQLAKKMQQQYGDGDNDKAGNDNGDNDDDDDDDDHDNDDEDDEKRRSAKKTKKSSGSGKGDSAAEMHKRLLLAQREAYVEYDRSGNVVKGLPVAKAISKYEEDLFPGNHSSVWGSYWSKGRWGFACCHQMSRNAYCLGQRGREAAAAAATQAAAEAATKSTFTVGQANSNSSNSEAVGKEVVVGQKRMRE